ncbi:MAG TPA: YihY/virulence factor BrkB family protein [Methylomirabilota bacterium]|jgi:membrane protein
MADEPSPWKLGGLSVVELAKRVWREIGDDEVTDRAAALTYYFVFSLFPTLLFLTALIGLLPIPNLMDQLMGYVSQVLPGDAASIVSKTLGEIVAGAHGGLLSIGALTALWAGSNGMASIMTALNVAYDVSDNRPWWTRRGLSIVLTFGFAMFILTGLIFMVFGPKIGSVVAAWFGLGDFFMRIWNLANLPIAIFLVTIGIALVYYLAPAAKQRWRWVTPGSVVAVALWLAMSYVLRLYVSNFANYNATYGSIGGVILLMLWLYLTGVVLLVGAEVNAEIEHAAARRGAVDAKEKGEVAPGVESPPAPLSVTREGDDARVAARVITRQMQAAHERGLVAVASLAVGAVLGWVMARRPLDEVSDTAAKGLDIAHTIAAADRLREAREEARRAHGKDAA